MFLVCNYGDLAVLWTPGCLLLVMVNVSKSATEYHVVSSTRVILSLTTPTSSLMDKHVLSRTPRTGCNLGPASLGYFDIGKREYFY